MSILDKCPFPFPLAFSGTSGPFMRVADSPRAQPVELAGMLANNLQPHRLPKYRYRRQVIGSLGITVEDLDRLVEKLARQAGLRLRPRPKSFTGP